MPRSCSICSRADRNEIDQALVSGASLRDISNRFGDVSRSALDRHRRSHLPTSVALVPLERSALAGTVILDEVGRVLTKAEGLLETAEELLNEARASGEMKWAIPALRAVGDCVDRIAKLHFLQADRAPVEAVVIEDDSSEGQEYRALCDELVDVLAGWHGTSVRIAARLMDSGREELATRLLAPVPASMQVHYDESGKLMWLAGPGNPTRTPRDYDPPPSVEKWQTLCDVLVEELGPWTSIRNRIAERLDAIGL